MEKQPATRIFDILEALPSLYRDGREVFATLSGDKQIRYFAGDYIRNAEKLGCALLNAGINKGDRVATLLDNRPEWNILDMGILLAGAVHVPVYPTLSADNFRYIFADAGIRMLFVNDAVAYQRVRDVLDFLPNHTTVISVDRVEGLRSMGEFMELPNDDLLLEELRTSARSISGDTLATIIYTSGTTGKPKGVMLSHTNLVSNFMEVTRILAENPMKNALSVLPLCHVYERILNYAYQQSGLSVHYVPSLNLLKEGLKHARPEIFCAVPRILEKSFARFLQRGRHLRGLRRKIFFWVVELGQHYEPSAASGLIYGLKLLLADVFVFSKLRKGFGGRLNTIVCGGASLNPKIARLLWAAGIKVIEGYGLTETSPVIAVGNFGKNGVLIGTVGPILPGVQIAFAHDGEILCKGPNVMMGYYNRPERTAEIIDSNGWLHTGDIGKMVNGRFLQITDRKKEMFKTSGGKYVAPQVMENRFKESPFIEFVMVVGENRNFPAALVVPNFIYLRSWCYIKGISYTTNGEMIRNRRIIDRITREIAATNKLFSHPEQVKAFRLLSDPWSIETGELSPTMKMRRSFIAEKYAAIIAQIYS